MDQVWTQGVFNRLPLLLAGDTVTLGTADLVSVMLSKTAFTPSRTSVTADLTEATFDGYSKIQAEAPPQFEGIDPNNGDGLVTIKPPAGGWRWETTGLTDLPQTIYGMGLVNADSDVLYGCAVFETPIVLDGINQPVIIGDVTFRIPNAAIQ